MADKQQCRLLALPAELRNEIYRLAFEGTITTIKGRHYRGQWARVEPTSSDNPGLLLANKQLYAEARLIYYSTVQHQAINRYELIRFIFSRERMVQSTGADMVVQLHFINPADSRQWRIEVPRKPEL